MPTPAPTKKKVEAAVAAYIEHDGPRRSWSAIKKSMGYNCEKSAKESVTTWAEYYAIPVPPRLYEQMTTLERRKAEMEYQEGANKEAARPVYTLPNLPSPDLPIEDVLSRLARDAERRIDAHDARQWAPIKLRDDGPYGLWFWGDPHLDDDGCAHNVLQEHVAEVQRNPHMLSVGMGDYQNNWVGRLAKLYANQEMSARTAWRLVEWWVKAVRPALLLKGNHDLWAGVGDPLNWMVTHSDTFTADWVAKVAFQSPNGRECRLWAAHDFKGSSMWNPLHANQRKAKESGARAHIYVAGHRHEWGAAVHEDPDSGHVYTLLRARGYKVLDSYAEQSGYGSQRYGHSVAVIVDPDARSDDRFIQTFPNPMEASEYLKWKRKRVKKAA